MNKTNEQTRLTIGHALHCDVVVASPGVKPHHCTLIGRPGNWALVPEMGEVGIGDPTSTSIRWHDLPIDVAADSDLWLTGEVRMPWPDERECIATLYVGRARDADIVIDEDSISGRHALLMIGCKNTVVLKDLDSTNGVYLAPPFETRVRALAIVPNQSIYFGTHKIDCDQLTPPQYFAAKSQPKSAVEFPRSFRTPLIGLTVLALLVATAFFLSRTSDSSAIPDQAAVADAAQERSAKPTPTESAASGDPSKVDRPSSSDDLGQESPARIRMRLEQAAAGEQSDSLSELVRRATYWVTVHDAKTNTNYRLGSAFCIDANKLVTSASVITAIDELTGSGYSDPRMFAVIGGRPIPLTSRHVWSEYQQRLNVADVLRQRFDQLDKDQGSSVDRERLAETINFSYAAVSASDIGWIEVKESLDHRLELAPIASITPGEMVHIVDCGFVRSAPAFQALDDAYENTEQSTLSCQVLGSGSNVAGIPGAIELEVVTDRLVDHNVIGLPVLFRKKVAGMVVYQFPSTGQNAVRLEVVCGQTLRDAIRLDSH